MAPLNSRRCAVILFGLVLASKLCGRSPMLYAAEPGLPVGKWEIKKEIRNGMETMASVGNILSSGVVATGDNRGFVGSIVYTYMITLLPDGTGATTVTMEYHGTKFDENILMSNHGEFSSSARVHDRILAHCQDIKGVIERPITHATRKGNVLCLYSGGAFKLVTGTPPGCTVQEYGTAGTRFPEKNVNNLLSSFYGVTIYTIEGDDLVSKAHKDGKTTTWKKVN